VVHSVEFTSGLQACVSSAGFVSSAL